MSKTRNSARKTPAKPDLFFLLPVRLRRAIFLLLTLHCIENAESPYRDSPTSIVPGIKGCGKSPVPNGTQSRKLKDRSWKLEAARIPRYLALDVGNRRIGVAVSDELGLTAQPVLTLERRRNQREDLRSLARLARRFGVVGIVVGNPVHLSGELSPQAAKTQEFAAALGELSGLPIHLWDERLTTREAHQILYEAGHARQEHRRVVDQVAATLILQSFLEKQRSEIRDQGSGDSE
jgi:putative Holliday junction resolvase